MSRLLANKHAAIVGGTGAIGLPIAKLFSSHGARVTILSRSAQKRQSVLEPSLTPFASSSENGPEGRHRFIALDVEDPKNIESKFRGRDEHAVGCVDLLVNCAGISQTTMIQRTSATELQKIVNTNLTATMLACKFAKMEPNGCIINVSSLMAEKATIGAAAYSAAKAGVNAFTKALCLEMQKRPVRVNALLPGWVDSPMWNDIKPDLQQRYLDEIPLRRVATPGEVANAALFLAVNEYANNCVLNLDGGLSAV